MRDYAKVSPAFWTGETGRTIRALGRNCQVLAMYLMTCPGSAMTGVYYMPLSTAAYETGMSLTEVTVSLDALRGIGFVATDPERDLVWVVEMARHQMSDVVKPSDKRHVAMIKDLAKLTKSPIVRLFWAKYAEAFSLPMPCPCTATVSPIEAPSKPHRSQEKDQDQDLPPGSDHDLERSLPPESSLSRPAQRAGGIPDPDPSGVLPQDGAPAAVTTGRYQANRMDDGCFGQAVEAWERVYAKTMNRTFTRLVGTELTKLIEAMRAHCPNINDRNEWAKREAEAFAKADPSGTMRAHRFADWLDRGRKTAAQAKAAEAPKPPTPPSRKNLDNLGRPPREPANASPRPPMTHGPSDGPRRAGDPNARDGDPSASGGLGPVCLTLVRNHG